MTHGAMHKHWSTLWVTRFQRYRPGLQAIHGAMRRYCSTVIADTLAEIEAETLGNTWGAAQPPVNLMRASRARVESETQGHILSDAQTLVETLAD